MTLLCECLTSESETDLWFCLTIKREGLNEGFFKITKNQ